MIKLIHRYNKLITYVFLFVAVCFMFSGVGLDILHGGSQVGSYAIKINDKEVSATEFNRARENLTARYRQMFGDNFEALAKQFNLNLTQQAIDSIVDANLLAQEADKWGFAGNDEAVNRYLITKIFAGREISKDAIRAMLQNLGMNYRQFSSEIKQEVSREAFANLLRDASFVSDRDIREHYIRQETTFSVLATSVPARSFLQQIVEPSEDILLKLYNETATNYELPARIAYEYLVFAADDFRKDVQVSAQDLELYYTENLSKFRTPEKARIRSITLLYPKESDPKAMADIKIKAKRVYEEASSGQPFIQLVEKYSDDLPTKLAGGSKGWIERGAGTDAFDKAVFSAKEGTIAELIASDSGYEIVLVEERKEAGQKPFSEVKDTIERTIREREAPAYAAAKAQELAAAARKSSAQLSAIAASNGLPGPKTLSLSGQDVDPDPLLKGLTQKALQLPASERLIATTVDIGNSTVVLQVKEFKEPAIPPLADVRDAVLASFRTKESLALAEKNAQELLNIIKENPTLLETSASSRGFQTSGPFTISRSNPSNKEFAQLTSEMTDDIFSSSDAPRAINRVFKNADEYLVLVLHSVQKPDPSSKAAQESLKKYRDEATQRQEQEAMMNAVALLKLRSTIDIDPALLTQ